MNVIEVPGFACAKGAMNSSIPRTRGVHLGVTIAKYGMRLYNPTGSDPTVLHIHFEEWRMGSTLRHGTARHLDPSARRSDEAQKILWVDDDWTASAGDREVLRRVGYDIQGVTGVAACVSSVRQSTLDLIILSVRHPAPGALATLNELRRAGIATPVLVLTELGDTRLAFAAGRLGADVCECRPFRGEALIAAVRTALALRSNVAFEPYRPASERLARVVVATSLHPTDWRSLRALAAAAGVGYGTLRAWCHSAGVRDRSFNRFCRMFRAVRLAPTTGSRPEDLLDVIEPRRLHLMFRDAGIDEGEQRLERYCERQTFIAKRSGIAQIALSMIEY